MYRAFFGALAVMAAMTAAVSQAYIFAPNGLETIRDDFNIGDNFDTTNWQYFGGSANDTRFANDMAEVPKRELVDIAGPEVNGKGTFAWKPSDIAVDNKATYDIVWGDDGMTTYVPQAGIFDTTGSARACVTLGNAADPSDHYGSPLLFVYDGHYGEAGATYIKGTVPVPAIKAGDRWTFSIDLAANTTSLFINGSIHDSVVGTPIYGADERAMTFNFANWVKCYPDFVSTGSQAPEPSTCVLLATGLIGLLAYAWRKRK